jgi:MoaA/NifB/PqqE/SkfB family radical SAM enzyme
MKLLNRIRLLSRLASKAVGALVDPYHPLIVQIVPIRRCNLACAYCNQYDHSSSPVPLAVMQARIDRLANLGTAIVTISGGEPLLHPELDAIVHRIRRRGMIATLITNGYELSPRRIARLNRSGLEHLQISIDNVEPDAVSLKSLRLLEPKLRWLAELARFEVNINSVLGAGIARPQDALAVARRARELGFTSSVGLLDGHGAEVAGWSEVREVYRELKKKGDWTRFISDRWQDNVVAGRPSDWKCRAGARYLYVDEFGLVHYCSSQRGAPAIPLERYSRADLVREHGAKKPCAPYCTINCVQQASLIDGWRAPQTTEARIVPLVVKPAPPRGLEPCA